MISFGHGCGCVLVYLCKTISYPLLMLDGTMQSNFDASRRFRSNTSSASTRLFMIVDATVHVRVDPGINTQRDMEESYTGSGSGSIWTGR